METHNYSEIKILTIEKIRGLGFDVIVNEGITVQQDGNEK